MAWASQGSHMLAASWGAGHRPPQEPDAPGPICGSKVFPSGDGATWPFSFLPPAPASLPSPKSRVPGLCQQGAGLHCPSVTGHCGPEWTSGLPQPPQPRHLWSRATQRKESQDQGEAMLHCELAKWQSGALLASPWPLRVTPEGPTMPELPLPGRVCSAEGQRVGHGP